MASASFRLKSSEYSQEIMQSQATDKFVAPQRDSEHPELHENKNIMLLNLLPLYLTDFFKLFDMYVDKSCVDVLFWQTTWQSMAPQGRDTEHQHLHDIKNIMFSNPLSLSLSLSLSLYL